MFSEHEILEIFELIGKYDPNNPQDVQKLVNIANSLGVSREQLQAMLGNED